MSGRPYQQKVEPGVIVERFSRLCQMVEFGQIIVEVANGVPKDVQVTFQNFRLDLTNPTSDGMLDLNKKLDSSHGGGS